MNRREFSGMAAALPLSGWIRRRENEVSGGLTDVEGLKVGHVTLRPGQTGCTVVLAESGAVAGVDVRGSAPGTRETDLLDPVKSIQKIHAVLLSGGSAFGLDAASGVVRYLEERNIGFPTSAARVPIVPAAILYDLNLGDPSVRPDRESGYRACLEASTGPIAEGNVGAGTGATVGKLLGFERAMKGGVGTTSLRVGDLVVAALIAVNAVGDVIDPDSGRVIAGARTRDGSKIVDMRRYLRESSLSPPPRDAENTTIGVVATNADLTKPEATKIAQMAHDGLARAVYPAHLPWDGDTLFALSTGALKKFDLGQVGALAAEVVSRAILRAVIKAESVGTVLSCGDLAGKNP